MKSLKLGTYSLSVASLGLILSCVTVPKELTDARQAYQHASDAPMAYKARGELREAEIALQQAERSYKKSPHSYQTLDLAYIAQRKAQLAEGLSSATSAGEESKRASQAMTATQNEIIRKSKDELSQARDDLNRSKDALSQSTEDANELRLELANRAVVKEEPRGVVITLSGSVLFASGKSELLPSAQARLSDVCKALLKTDNRELIVEGHTDSQGSSSYNMDLSQRRAEAVRSYMISRGYPSELITARGIGKDRPIANNNSVEGRANNRRVEIVVIGGE